MFLFKIFVFFFIANTCWCLQRTLKSQLNPGCGEKICDNITTFYLRADGVNDTLHYLWDFYKRPSLFLAVTTTSSNLTINWNSYLSDKNDSIKFTEAPIYTFGFVINKIIEFNDTNDTGMIDKVTDSSILILKPEYFHWTLINVVQHNTLVELHMSGEHYHDPINNINKNGSIQIILNGFYNMNHSDVIPHMYHSENSTQIDVIINNFETSFKNSRFGFELLTVSQSNKNLSMIIDTKKSIDDEYSPGVMTVISMKLPEDRNKTNDKGYIQWRPVSYLSRDRLISSSTETIYYDIKNSLKLNNMSILYAYYGDDDQRNDILIQKINVTIGVHNDGFYRNSNYSTWTFIAGYGSPPVEQFSNFVIMIIIIGMGLPIIILFIGALYMAIRKFARPLPDNNFTNFQ
ncbi:hypothetical protein HCN44_002801 [Aphidius gifuensis]|uniref:Lysosomal protein NCU-G1 n=1 Tax=Aphidius gifuensis TaxID=684658 RepID=A0A834XU21_APHGI|nr:glycosylated lysosomal membrane protein-like [Aphidius gifuensis]KAF7991239.1 hypothetical protein HCN44_002801 [Aphidius gifuensis]